MKIGINEKTIISSKGYHLSSKKKDKCLKLKKANPQRIIYVDTCYIVKRKIKKGKA